MKSGRRSAPGRVRASLPLPFDLLAKAHVDRHANWTWKGKPVLSPGGVFHERLAEGHRIHPGLDLARCRKANRQRAGLEVCRFERASERRRKLVAEARAIQKRPPPAARQAILVGPFRCSVQAIARSSPRGGRGRANACGGRGPLSSTPRQAGCLTVVQDSRRRRAAVVAAHASASSISDALAGSGTAVSDPLAKSVTSCGAS